MIFKLLFVVCMGISFTPWIEARQNYYVPPLIEERIRELEANISEFKSECALQINKDILEPQPLLISPGAKEFYIPDSNGFVRIGSGQSIEFYCNKGGFQGTFAGQTKITPKCLGNDQFEVNGKTYPFKKLLCDKPNVFMARRTNQKCFNNSTVANIGFALTNSRFIVLMQVCHNEQTEETHYVAHKLNPSSAIFQKNITRPFFQQGSFYKNKNVNKLYTFKKQKSTVGKILGGDHEKYFNEDKYMYMARGHLTAKADFIFGPHQLSTFYFINAAPQWQRFNSGNWQNVEDSVRNFVTERKMHAQLYTGTWGVTTLKDTKGKHKELYLYFDENGNGRIPVPKIYYKIVIDSKTKNGVVFIGVNNPHLTLEEIQKDYILCKDISDSIKWVNWQKTKIISGYSYACEVNEFLKVIKHLPNLKVNNVLY